MALVPVTTVGLIGSLQAHSNIGRLCSQFNISDDELVQIVKDEQCIKVKVGNIKLSFKDIIGNNNNVKCVLVDRIKNTIGNCDDTRLRDLLAYISGALYTTVAHAMHSQIMQAFGNQGWAHWARNSKQILVLKIRHSL
jgi:hypothetical protein